MNTKLIQHVLLLTSFISALLFGANAFAAPDAEAQEFWMKHDPSSEIEVSHEAWQNLLDSYLDAEHPSGVNRFDYAAVTKADRELLDKYLESLQALDPRTLNKNEQLAYWINFYNALTAQVVLEEYPVDSIRSIRFLTSPFGPWDKNLVVVQGKKLSLNDIEHGILRPIWKDPRIHFAVNCASIGCPNLDEEAFTATNANELMEAAAKSFINHARGVEIKGETLVLSSIFDWYGSDFGENEQEIVAYIARFYEPSNRDLETISKFEYQYDWNLNKAE